MEPLVRLEDVHKTYRAGEVDVPVLRGIDLTIRKGEHVAIMGRSGSGKSTLMNILGCLDRPTSGRYLLEERDTSGLDDDAISTVRGQTIGFVFQQFHLLPGRTVRENVELPMEYLGTAPEERRARATELLTRVGLAHRLGHRPTQLSGGEKQRVCIARALANRPRLLLADEPTGALDSRATKVILELFAELHRETGVTLVIVTHDEGVGRAAPRLVEVADGKVVG
jgi:putative ABC transport system ATP-binding protein